MKIVQINATCGVGSTGKICVGISEILNGHRIENHILYSNQGSGYEQGISCADGRYIRAQALLARGTGKYGFHSKGATKRIIRELERLKPDLVHLHNIHGHDCHLQMLFTYFRENKTKLVWTFHDCWAFTGYCVYFDAVKCDKWTTCCEACVQRKNYSCFFDKSRKLFEKKKELFSGLDMTIVSPSNWLAKLVKRSFLKDYPVTVINNGIDLESFRPRVSDFREKHGFENKKILLGVAMEWESRKGLDVFVQLAKRLPEEYQMVLVGTDEAADRQLPEGVFSIHRTQSQQELTELYSAADLFVNPTREENYPTVNMEALACGTPVVTFRTGGSPEMLDDTCGSVVDRDDVDALEKEILRICTQKPYSREACVNRAKEFDQKERFAEYFRLYERLCPPDVKSKYTQRI